MEVRCWRQIAAAVSGAADARQPRRPAAAALRLSCLPREQRGLLCQPLCRQGRDGAAYRRRALESEQRAHARLHRAPAHPARTQLPPARSHTHTRTHRAPPPRLLPGIEYTKRQATPPKAPRGTLPFICHGPHTVADSACILRYLRATYPDNAKLQALFTYATPQEQGVAVAVQALLDNRLFGLLLPYRWFEPAGYEVGGQARGRAEAGHPARLLSRRLLLLLHPLPRSATWRCLGACSSAHSARRALSCGC